MRNIKATIILLTYNQERTVARAMESLLRQRCDYEFEILVADDASPDSTRALCEEYARKYPGKVRMQPAVPNRGIVGNYFDAFEAAQGEYISDCAGDDEWLDEERLQKSIELLDADPGLSGVFTDVEICQNGRCRNASDDKERSKWMRKRVPGREILIDTLNNTNSLPFILSSALYRKAAVEKIYADHKEVIRCPEGCVEDLPLIAAIGYAGDVAYLPISGYRYYIEGESASNNLDYRKEYMFYARLLSVVARLAKFYNIPLRKLQRHYNDKMNFISSRVRMTGDPELRRDIKKRAKDWGMRLPFKAQLNLLLSYLATRRHT